MRSCRLPAQLVASISLVGCATLGFEMPRGHCALEPEGCNGALPRLEPRRDYPRYASNAWASDGSQGLAHDDTHWYVTSTRRIWKIALEEPMARARPEGVIPFSGQYAHLGDPDFHDGVLFVPLEKDRRGGPPAIGALRGDLTPIGIQPLQGASHAPWCAVHPVTGRLYTSSFSADHMQIFRIEITADRFTLVHERDLPLRYSDDSSGNRLRGRVPRIQGGVISRTGKLYLATHHERTGIVVFDAESGAWLGRIPIAFKPRWSGLTRQEVEGIDLLDLDRIDVPGMTGQLHVLLRAEIPKRRYWLKHWGVVDPEDVERL